MLKKLETDTENRQEQEQGLEIVKAQVEQERAELEKERIQL